MTALHPCPECGHQVSESAITCPSCGVREPAKSPETTVRDRKFLIGCLATMVGAPLVLMATCVALMDSPSPSAATRATVDRCTQRAAFMTEVRRAQSGGSIFTNQATCNQGTLRLQAADGWRIAGCQAQIEMVGAMGRVWARMEGVRLLVTGAGGTELASYGITGRASVRGC